MHTIPSLNELIGTDKSAHRFGEIDRTELLNESKEVLGAFRRDQSTTPTYLVIVCPSVGLRSMTTDTK